MLNRKQKRVLNSIFFYLLIGTIVLIFVFPPLYVAFTSFKFVRDAFVFPPKLLSAFTLSNYISLFEKEQAFGHVLVNSLVISIATTIVTIVVGSPAAYALTRYKFMGRHLIFLFILCAMIAPPVFLVFPMFIFYNWLGLVDSYATMIIIYTVFLLPLVIWILRNFFADIPIDLDEAAMIDGCSVGKAFMLVILPIARPGLIAVGVFAFIAIWNDFFWALVFTRQATRTLTVSTLNFIGVSGVQWGELSAAATIAMIPVFLFTFLMQRRLTSGLTSGAVKG